MLSRMNSILLLLLLLISSSTVPDGSTVVVSVALPPGLLESTYETCFGTELVHRGHRVDRQVAVPITYRDTTLECGYRLDLLVDRQLVVEIKAVAAFEPVHTAQVLTYLRFSGLPLGILLNFNVRLLKEGGIRRVVWGQNVPAFVRPGPDGAPERWPKPDAARFGHD